MKISERVARSRWHPLSVGSLKRSEKLIGGDALPVFHNAIAARSLIQRSGECICMINVFQQVALFLCLSWHLGFFLAAKLIKFRNKSYPAGRALFNCHMRLYH